jgi:iron complex transport system permease protein
MRGRLGWLLVAGSVVAFAAAAIQTLSGAYEMSWREALAALFDPDLWSRPGVVLRFLVGDAAADRLGLDTPGALATSTLVVWNIRVPRLLVGALVGANLALSGAVFQAITRNDLASPYLLGVSSGAGLAAVLVFVVYPGLGVHLPLIASLGGVAAFLLVYSIAWHRGTTPSRLILAGVIVGSIAGSVQTGLLLMAPDLNVARDVMSWTTGSLTGVGWSHVRVALPWTLLVATLTLAGSRYLDLLMLGDGQASALGVRIERTRFALAAVAILAAATSISVAGQVGFVGLIVPHIVRNTIGPAHRSLLLGCLVAGPALMAVADTTARLALSPVQLPVGLVTGAVGGTYFLYLMRRRRELGR